MEYNLEKRTEKFSEDIIDLCQKLPKTAITLPLIKQIIRSATSIGANYSEANGASSPKDFRNKILICKRESMETRYWLKMFFKAIPNQHAIFAILYQEAHELSLIFSKIALIKK
ncbi:MAG: four helix bundle protein [Candidatus Shapirobacteria bacterium]|jgi:four helix bundle protein